jgi:phosphoglycolate phosphatase
MVRLALFDVDGTLVHTGGAGVRAFAKVFATEFGALDGIEKMKFAGRTDVSLVREFLNLHAIAPTPEHFTRFFESYVFWLDQLLPESHTSLCPGVWKFLRELQALPEPPVLGLLTGNIRLGAEIKLRHFSLWEVFRTGAFADDHEERDQIAAIARQRGSRLLNQELRGDEILVVGDTYYDVRCGRAIDARVLAVATGGATLEQLQSCQPNWAVRDLNAISAEEVAGG